MAEFLETASWKADIEAHNSWVVRAQNYLDQVQLHENQVLVEDQQPTKIVQDHQVVVQKYLSIVTTQPN